MADVRAVATLGYMTANNGGTPTTVGTWGYWTPIWTVIEESDLVLSAMSAGRVKMLWIAMMGLGATVGTGVQIAWTSGLQFGAMIVNSARLVWTSGLQLNITLVNKARLAWEATLAFGGVIAAKPRIIWDTGLQLSATVTNNARLVWMAGLRFGAAIVNKARPVWTSGLVLHSKALLITLESLRAMFLSAGTRVPALIESSGRAATMWFRSVATRAVAYILSQGERK